MPLVSGLLFMLSGVIMESLGIESTLAYACMGAFWGFVANTGKD